MADRNVISIVGLGGDHAPRIVVDGLERNSKWRDYIRFILHGDETKIRPLMEQAPPAAPRTEIRHTDKFVTMDAKPSHAVRRGKGS
jgi:glycerol-3-phosphate acyltransferase PlsX